MIDAHQHFWDPARASYDWMTEEVAAIRRPFGADDLKPLLAVCGIDRTIAVQARPSVAETIDLLAIAAAHEIVAGVVGWVDLTAADVDVTLAEVAALPGGHKLVGIRHQVHDEADPRWLLREDVQRGLTRVAESGLVFELLVRTRELPASIATVARHPSMTFVVDHLAKPPIRSGDDREWSRYMEELSAYPNVAVKLSGLVTEADWKGWTPEQLVPYGERTLGWFGAGRILFGSDWPVCILASTYEEVFATYRQLVRDLVPAGEERVFGSNAEQLYRLSVTASASDVGVGELSEPVRPPCA